MSGRIKVFFYFSLPLVLLVTSCARPNYRPPNAVPLPQEKSEKPSQTCELRMPVLNFCISIDWQKQPSATSFGQFQLKFYRPDDSAPNLDPNLKPEVILFMPSMGHGSSKTTVEFAGENSFLVTRVFFIMPGDWEIRVRYPTHGSEYDEAIQKFKY